MTAPHPIASFLDNLLGGVQAGTNFKNQRIDTTRRRAFEDDNQQLKDAAALREGVAAQLTQGVQQAQIDNYRSEIAARDAPDTAKAHTYTPETIGGVGYNFDPATGQYSQPLTASPPPPPHNIDPNSPEGIRAANAKARFAAGLKPEKATAVPKPSTASETAYSVLPALLAADKRLDALTPTGVGGLISRGGLAGRMVLSDAQKQYNDGINDLGLQYVTAVHGKRVNQEVVHSILGGITVGGADTDASMVQSKVDRRKGYVKGAQRTAAAAIKYHLANGDIDQATADQMLEGTQVGPPAAGRNSTQPTDQQAHWDALAQKYGAAETTKQVGPRP